MHRLEVVGLQQADTLSLVWDRCHRWQQGLGTATGHIQGHSPASLPGHTRGHRPVPCVHSPPVPWAGLFFEALQGHGLLLPISKKGQLRPSRNALSAASTSAPQNIFPSQRGSLLTVGSAAVPVVVVPTMPLTVSSRAQGVWDGFVGGLGRVGSAGNKSGGGRERPCPTVLQGTALSPTHPLARDVPGWVSQLSPITGQQQHVSQARGSWWWSGCFCSAPACPRTLPPLAEALALKRSCQKDVLNGQL